jgi:purine-binding chemotaxis protein CheW
MSGTRQYTSCVVGNQLVGISVDAVQEVTSVTDLTPVPLASPLISGLLNLRGEIITAIDLRRCLQMSDRSADQRPVNLILRTDEGPVAVLVDQIGDVLDVDDDQFESPPPTLQGRGRELISGVYKLAGGLLLVVRTEALLAVASEHA